MRHTILAIALLSAAALSALPAQASLLGQSATSAAKQPYMPNNLQPSSPYNKKAGPVRSPYCNLLVQHCVGFQSRFNSPKNFQ